MAGTKGRLPPEEVNRRRVERTAAYRARRSEEFALPREIDLLLQKMQQRGSSFVVFDKRKLIALFRGDGK